MTDYYVNGVGATPNVVHRIPPGQFLVEVRTYQVLSDYVGDSELAALDWRPLDWAGTLREAKDLAYQYVQDNPLSEARIVQHERGK